MPRTRSLVLTERSERYLLGGQGGGGGQVLRPPAGALSPGSKGKAPYFRLHPGEVETLSSSPGHPCLSSLTDLTTTTQPLPQSPDKWGLPLLGATVGLFGGPIKSEGPRKRVN